MSCLVIRYKVHSLIQTKFNTSNLNQIDKLLKPTLHKFYPKNSCILFFFDSINSTSYLFELSSDQLEVLDAIQKIKSIEASSFLKPELFVTLEGVGIHSLRYFD